MARRIASAARVSQLSIPRSQRLLLQAEYRWEVLPFLSGALFYDAGTVAASHDELRLDALKQDYGFGLRFGVASGVFLRTDIAFGGADGPAFGGSAMCSDAAPRCAARRWGAVLRGVVVSGVALTLGHGGWRAGRRVRFFPDDPIAVDDDRAFDASVAKPIELGNLSNFIENTLLSPGDRSTRRALNVNTLDEVPDSSWFTNRIGRRADDDRRDRARARSRRPPARHRLAVIVAGKNTGLPARLPRRGPGAIRTRRSFSSSSIRRATRSWPPAPR